MAVPILIVTPWYGRSERGGVALAVDNLVHTLRSRGRRVFVIVTGIDGWYPTFKRGSLNERVIYLPLRHRKGRAKGPKPFLGYWGRLLLAMQVLVFLFLRYRPLVHFHYCCEEYDEMLLIARAFHRPIVTTFHGSDVFIAADSAPMRQVTGKLIDYSTTITTVSRGLLDELRRKFPGSKAKSLTVFNSVHVKFLAQAAEGVTPNTGDLDVLFVGALLPIKGPDLLIEAFEEVVQRRPNARLCLVGTGKMEPALRESIRRGNLKENVELAGSVAHSNVIDYYRRAKVIVLPSRSEGFSLVAAEAALMGRPVVATRVGGLPEVVVHDGGGLIVPPNDAKELAKAILSLLENPKLSQKFGNYARTRALKVFDPQQMGTRFEQLYQSAFNRRNGFHTTDSRQK